MIEETEKEFIVVEPNSQLTDSVIKEPLLARIVSVALHPLFMMVYTIVLIFGSTDLRFMYSNQFLQFITPVVFLSCAIPVSGIYLLKTAKIISDYSLKNKREWFLPFMIYFLSFGLLFYYFYSAKLSIWFLSVLLIPIILLLIYFAVIRFWNISVYMMGIGALIGSILSISYNIKGLNLSVLFIILFILAGILGVSRLALKRNTPAQIYIGFLVGIVVSYLAVLIGAYWGIMIFLKNI